MVHTSTYWYILVRTGTDGNQPAHFIGSRSVRPPAPTSLCRTIGLVLSHSFLKHGSLLHSQITQAWLATAKVPQYIPVHASTYRYILVCTCMYWYILVHASTYWYEVISTGSGMYWYIILVHTSSYWYVHVCTCMQWYILIRIPVGSRHETVLEALPHRCATHENLIHNAITFCLFMTLHTSTFQYGLVNTGMYWYVLVCTCEIRYKQVCMGICRYVLA